MKTIFFFLIASLLGCVHTHVESVGPTVRNMAKEQMKFMPTIIEKAKKGGSFCEVGLQWPLGDTLVSVSEIGMKNGLQPGDKILTFNGVKWLSGGWEEMWLA